MLKTLPGLLILTLALLPCLAAGQAIQTQAASSHSGPGTRTLSLAAPSAATSLEALALCSAAEGGTETKKVVVIGFVGGFARGDDQKHPEVQFAEFLRDRYGSDIFSKVFANHQGREALRTVVKLLGSGAGGTSSSVRKHCPRIILYGHSWGAAETVIFARELGKLGIPVFLTIQVDSIAKPGHEDLRIPSNVTNAINLYQSRGPLQGQTEISAAEPAHTTIIGNLHMTYEGHLINCENYPWFARTFNRPHHEIENDPRVWDLLASLIRASFQTSGLTTAEFRPATQSMLRVPQTDASPAFQLKF